MKRTVLTTVISSLLTVATTNAMASAVKTAPASVTEAQHNTAIASENYHAALTTFNAAPSSEREYAAGKLDTAHDKYTTAVLAEKVAIKQWLTPDLNVAPTQVAASPAAAPSLGPQATPVSHAVCASGCTCRCSFCYYLYASSSGCSERDQRAAHGNLLCAFPVAA